MIDYNETAFRAAFIRTAEAICARGFFNDSDEGEPELHDRLFRAEEEARDRRYGSRDPRLSAARRGRHHALYAATSFLERHEAINDGAEWGFFDAWLRSVRDWAERNHHGEPPPSVYRAIDFEIKAWRARND